MNGLRITPTRAASIAVNSFRPAQLFPSAEKARMT